MTEELRRKIANVDAEILKLAAQRIQTADKIGIIKRKEGLDIVNPEVEAIVFLRAQEMGTTLGLNPSFVKRLMELLIREAIQVQNAQRKRGSELLCTIQEQSYRLEVKGKKVIRLDMESLTPTVHLGTKEIYGQIGLSWADTEYAYSKSSNELRKAIANSLNERYGIEIDHDQVLVASSRKLVVFIATMALLSFGKSAVIPTPTSPFYIDIVEAAGGRRYLLHTCFEDKWEMDIVKLTNFFRVNPSLLILCTPNNPTGKVYSERTIREATEMAEKSNSYLLIDKVDNDSSVPSYKNPLQVVNSNFVYVDTIPQHGMLEWKTSYAISDHETVDKMRKLASLSTPSIPDVFLKTATETVNEKKDSKVRKREERRIRIKLASKELKALHLNYTLPEGGNYIFPRVEDEDFKAENFATWLLDEEKVAISPGEVYGDYPQHFRISLNSRIEEIREGIRRIGIGLERWHRK